MARCAGCLGSARIRGIILARLVLHIGAHKTATSYLQRLFHRNRELLAKHGIIYPDVGPNRAHHILVTPWIDVPEIPASYYGRRNLSQWLRSEKIFDSFFERIIAKHAGQKGTVFLSAEVFSRAEPQCVDMRDLAQRLKAFEDVRIVYTVRHQVEYIQSIWLQLAKNNKAPRFDEFLKAALERQIASGLWVEHGKLIDHVLTGFSPEQLVILDYEAARRHPEGVVGPFLDLMNSSLRTKDLVKPNEKESNISPDPLVTWIAHSVQWPDAPRPDMVKALQGTFASIREQSGKKRTTLYTREKYKEVSDRFAEANAALDRWLPDGQAGPLLTPAAPPETLLFRDDFALSDWAALARQVSSLV